MTIVRPETASAHRGEARCPGAPSVQDIYRKEMASVPEELQEHWSYLGEGDIAKERYYTQEFHDLEVERLWSRVWQWACREDEIPNVGDTYVYEIAHLSIIVVRVEPDVIKAYWNSCLHRGTQLCSGSATLPEIRCPFHGWTWNLDGSMKELPCAWDLPHVDPARMSLPEVRVGRWGGFVFVNPDPEAEPFEDFIGVLPEHFRRWPLEHRAKAVHIAKIFRGNWKISMGAFLEGYHVPSTHPQIIAAAADTNCQYDFWDNVSRLIFMQAIPSPECPAELTEQEILDTALELLGLDLEVEVPPGSTARAVFASLGRHQLREQLGYDPPCTDAEVMDIIVYYLFPNFVVWAGYALPLVYRFRPYGNDPGMSVMEIILLSPLPDEAPAPPPAPTHWLGPDESFANAPELGAFLTPIYDQDASNIVRMQRGLRTGVKPGITLCDYQESLIRHHDLLLDRWISDTEDRPTGAGGPGTNGNSQKTSPGGSER